MKVAICVTVAVAFVIVAAQHTSRTTGEWTAYGADARNAKYSPLSDIDASNARDLKIAWRWSSPDNEIAKSRPDLFLNLFEGTPVAFDGSLYVSTGLNQVARIDGNTGETRWVYDPEIYKRGTPQRTGFVHRGVAVWRPGGRLFLASGDAYLTALDIATGKPIGDFGQQGSVDLLDGLRRPAQRFQFGVNSPPIVVGVVVVVGSFVQDGWRTMQGVPGDVRGYDARTGKLKWTFHTVPEGDDQVAATWMNESWKYSGSTNVWTVMSADEELGYVYLPTSTPTNDHYGGHRPGDNLFAESVVALDVNTGKRKWYFQTVHHGVWDYDLPAAPGPGGCDRRRQTAQGTGAGLQTSVRLRAGQGDRHAHLADRRAARAGVHGARRIVSAHTAVSNPAGAFRPPGACPRRSHRLHARVAPGSIGHREGI